jgi:hypothetical protein
MASSPQIPFNAATVRAGLRLAMTVGLPPVEADQPTFYFPPTSVTPGVTGEALDEEGVPFAPSTTVVRSTPAPVQVPCAVEYHDGSGKLENFGVIAASKIVLTLLDEDYDQVEGFLYVVIAGQKYWYRRTENATGLVALGIYTVHCESDDQG